MRQNCVEVLFAGSNRYHTARVDRHAQLQRDPSLLVVMAGRVTNRREALDELSVRTFSGASLVCALHPRPRRLASHCCHPPLYVQLACSRNVKALKAITNVYMAPLRDSR